jgi:hypothetical protein
MELTFDPYSWLPPPRDSSPGHAPGIAHPEWRALAARLAAAHAFQRHALQGERTGAARRSTSGLSPPGGSFHAATAGLLAGFAAPGSAGPGDETSRASGEGKMLADVNPTSSGDRKDTTGMVFTVAGSLPSGNRGLT